MLKRLTIILVISIGYSLLGNTATAIPDKDDWMININTATAEELMQLPGIGIVKAQRIIEHRKAHGGFTKTEDIMNVKGIGEKTFAKFADRITVGTGEKKARQVQLLGRKLTTWGEMKSAR